jgi:hypothetical protein
VHLLLRIKCVSSNSSSERARNFSANSKYFAPRSSSSPWSWSRVSKTEFSCEWQSECDRRQRSRSTVGEEVSVQRKSLGNV